MKIYTIAQRIDSVVDAALYVHAFGDAAFSKNSKCTTALRAIVDDIPLYGVVPYSYKVDGVDSIAPGTKVYTIQQVTTLNDGTKVYSNFGPDTGYLKKNKALKALKDLRAANPGARLALYSFKVDAPAEVPVQEFTFNVAISARTQAEADALFAQRYGVAA